MNTQEKIEAYINSQAEPKRADMEFLNRQILQLNPNGKLWFLDGTDETGKVISNPNIGYGQYTINYKDGSSKEFYQIGLSANTTGISIYIMGLEDRKYLPKTYGTTIGKASVSGYCIKFKTLKDIDMEVLAEAMKYGFDHTTL